MPGPRRRSTEPNESSSSSVGAPAPAVKPGRDSPTLKDWCPPPQSPRVRAWRTRRCLSGACGRESRLIPVWPHICLWASRRPRSCRARISSLFHNISGTVTTLTMYSTAKVSKANAVVRGPSSASRVNASRCFSSTSSLSRSVRVVHCDVYLSLYRVYGAASGMDSSRAVS